MADKHTITLEVLRDYGVDLTIPREVEFNIVSLAPIDERIVEDFAAWCGWKATIEEHHSLYIATLTARLVITEKTIRPLSQAVERLCQQYGWDYDGWGAFTYK